MFECLVYYVLFTQGYFSSSSSLGEYRLTIMKDNEGSSGEANYTTWFNFAVRGGLPGESIKLGNI